MAEFAIIKKSTLVNIANAIREMQGLPTDESEDGYVLIPTANMADEIKAIETGVDISATTLTTGAQLLYPLVAYDADGNQITGTIETKTKNDLSVDGAQVKVPAGYYAELATKSIQEVALSEPTISVDSNGKITSTVTQTASGYVESGTASKTKDLTNYGTVNPGVNAQTYVGKVTIAGYGNTFASNLKSGTSVFGVTGVYVPLFG